MEKSVNTAINLMRRLAYIPPNRPQSAQFEITNRCNLSCDICPRTNKYAKLKIGDMDYDVFTKAMDKLAPLRLATLTGWGEPMIHPRLYDMISYAMKNGAADTSISTNGVLLNDENITKLFESGLTSLRISVDNYQEEGGTGHPAGAKTMERVANLIKRRAGKIPHVSLAVTSYPENYEEVFKLIDAAARVKVDSVAILRMNHRFRKGLVRYTYEDEERVGLEYKAHGRKAGVSVLVSRDAHRGVRKLFYRGRTKCPLLLDMVNVTADGKITPCCFLPNQHVGDLMETDIETIWHSEEFGKFREIQEHRCTDCDAYTLKYKET